MRFFAQSLIDQAHDQITRLLTTEWLVSDIENTGGSIVPLGVNIALYASESMFV